MRFRTVGRALATVAAALALAVALGLALGALSHAAGATAADFSWNGAVPAGQTVAIHGINGGIHAVRASGDQVVVTAHKSARRSDPDRVRIEVSRHGGGVTICALYPDRSGHYGKCGPDGATNRDTGNNDVQVEFRVELPAGVRLDANTVNGGIEARVPESEVEAQTVNGNVSATLSRAGRAETVNGSVDARYEGAALAGPLRLRTVNGSISLAISPRIGAALRASTVNGSVHTDFPVTLTGSNNRFHVNGALGMGGPELRLETVNGSIRLTAAGGAAGTRL